MKGSKHPGELSVDLGRELFSNAKILLLLICEFYLAFIRLIEKERGPEWPQLIFQYGAMDNAE